MSPLYTALYWFPLFGSFLGTIGAWIALIIAIVLGCVLSTVTISIAWLFYRPLIGILMIAISVGILVVLELLDKSH